MPPIVNANLDVIVVERKYSVPVNAWCRARLWRKIGGMMGDITLRSVESVSFDVLVGILGWSKEAVESLLANVKIDLQNPNIHAFSTL
jgi:hypothetical protein